ncbi:IS110 family transposase [Streptomyces sp. MA5143a]|nr:IS110 family transposase [Streptomyces sp. MA5143a]
MPQIWAGVDIGKEHHHCEVADGRWTSTTAVPPSSSAGPQPPPQ